MTSLDLPASINQFSVDLYEQIGTESHAGNKKNIIISPFSVHLACGMLLMGARGETAREMSRGLKLGDADQTTISQAYEQLLASLKTNLQIFNKVFAMDTYHIKATFSDIAKKQFRAETESINFAQTEQAVKTINEWVEQRTNKRIKNVVSSDLLDSLTKVIVVSTVYFKGNWYRSFAPEETRKQQFFTSDSQSLEIDMMHKTDRFPFGNLPSLDAKLLVMSYAHFDLTMVVVLPNKRSGLDQLCVDLKQTKLSVLVQQAADYKGLVAISLPKFKVTFDVSLSDVLTRMGMKALFSSQADLSGFLDEPGPMCVRNFVHKVFIEVNETGIEAASADEAALCYISGLKRRPPPGLEEFTADHPFRYFICNKENMILFDGCFRKAESR